MKCDLFIRSYYKDLEWLDYCLASIDKFCSGFEVVVVIPQSSLAWLDRRFGVLEGVRLELCSDFRDDYLGQQVTKLHADRYSDADLICHVDADCIFTRPFCPEDLLVDGKPLVLTRPMTSLGRYKPWQGPTEDFLGWPVAYDFMAYPPFAFPRTLYAALRNFSLEKHGVDLEQYVISCPPRGFSEFNVLGAYAYEFRREEFTWIRTEVMDISAQFCKWYWSWGGLTEEIRAEIEAVLAS